MQEYIRNRSCIDGFLNERKYMKLGFLIAPGFKISISILSHPLPPHFPATY
jgi:hypothetical protein